MKIDFLKTTGNSKDEIKVSVIVANKSEVKAKSSIILISLYRNNSTISFFFIASFFLKEFFKASKEQKIINEI